MSASPLQSPDDLRRLFDLEGRVAVVIGGGGVLGRAIARGLGLAGAAVAIAGRTEAKATAAAEELKAMGIRSFAVRVDARDASDLAVCADAIEAELGPVDVLVNCAGGNIPAATAATTASPTSPAPIAPIPKGSETPAEAQARAIQAAMAAPESSPESSPGPSPGSISSPTPAGSSPGPAFGDLSAEALREVVDLNLFGGAILPSQVFGERMVRRGEGGSIIHISSMAAARPLTRVVGYGVAKAAVDNFTRWLAVHLAMDQANAVRVNAIAPGFFITEQNRDLLTRGDELTERGEAIVAHTPMGRFGEPEELIGVALWLASDASAFVTGAVIPVDGGFSAYSGV